MKTTFEVDLSDRAAVADLIQQLQRAPISLRALTENECRALTEGEAVFVRTTVGGDGLDRDGELGISHSYFRPGDIFVEVK